jgi:hypothetical protein
MLTVMSVPMHTVSPSFLLSTNMSSSLNQEVIRSVRGWEGWYHCL